MSYSRKVSDNIFVVTAEERPLENLLEFVYWNKILQYLAQQLTGEQLAQLQFHLIFGDSAVLAKPNPAMINVFIIADEGQEIRENLYNGTNIVFQSSYSASIFGSVYSRLFAFPIGYSAKLDLANAVPFKERSVNVFFSGNLHKGRKRLFDFYSFLRPLPFFLQHRLQNKLNITYDKKYKSSYIRFTNGFAKGLDAQDYAAYIKNSKVVLTPHGSIAEECFRHYEAMKCGCIIVSERLPDNYFFSDSPIIQIDNWKQGDKIIKELLARPMQMQALHEASLKWWQDVMSEPAVATYMKNIIERCLA